MMQYKILSNLKHNGQLYSKDQVVDVFDDVTAETLVKSGVIAPVEATEPVAAPVESTEAENTQPPLADPTADSTLEASPASPTEPEVTTVVNTVESITPAEPPVQPTAEQIAEDLGLNTDDLEIS